MASQEKNVAGDAEGKDENSTTLLKGFSGFGSFMQETSVKILIEASPDEYTPPHIPVDIEPTVCADFGIVQRKHFMLGSEYHFVNHGAFGAVARTVFEAATRWREYAEIQPLKFIDRELLKSIYIIIT